MTGSMSFPRRLRDCVYLVAILGASACGIFGPELESTNLRPLVPLPDYVIWHAQVESCVGRHRDFTAIRWFQADVLYWGDFEAGGFWGGNRITIRSDQLKSSTVVKYELIHFVMRNAEHNTALDYCAGTD